MFRRHRVDRLKSVNWAIISSGIVVCAKSLPEPLPTYCQLAHKYTFQLNFDQNKNAFQNIVCI